MKGFRSIVFWLHLGAGCVAGLVILAMSLTGILLAFERQINAWADTPAVLQGQPESTPPAPLDSLLATLQGSGQGSPSQLVLHNRPNAPVEARFGRERTLYLNPWTAEIIGQPSERTRAFFGSVERVHRSLGLGMQSAFGRGATGASNLAFLFMIVSGAYLWLPKVFNSTSFKTRLLFRGGLQGRAREWNWHNVIGVWTAIPLFFIVLSGVIMSYGWANNLLYTLTGSQPPARDARGGDRRPGGNGDGRTKDDRDASAAQSQFRTLDDLAQIAKQQVPNWKVITIDVPRGAGHTVSASLDKSVGGQPEQVSQLVLDRQTGRIDSVKRFSENVAGRKLRAWARFLHTGEEFGLLGQIIAALASIGAVVLVWTGISMAIRRLIATAKRPPATGTRRPVRQSETAESTVPVDA